MKELLASILLIVSSFFGFNHKTQTITPEPTIAISQSPTADPQELIETITSTPRIVITKKPAISKPNSSINEEILKQFFGIIDPDLVKQILNSKDQLSQYEHEYYQKYKTLPIPRLTIEPDNFYGMPSKNGTVSCSGNQLKNLYDEIRKTEEDLTYQQMDTDCHYNRSKQETKECQEWRRINDQNRVVPTKGSLDDEIARYQKKIEEYSNIYEQLLGKYCI